MSSTRAMIIVAGCLAAGGLAAQSPQPPAAAPAFEVASIKPNNSGDGRVMMQNQPGRYVATNITLRLLLRIAYQVQDFQMTGGPSWLNSDHFDINAKVPDEFRDQPPMRPGGGPGPLPLMIRALLADRFKLAVHNETKDSPIYALVLARSDGRLGPGLTKSETDCEAFFAAGRRHGVPMPPPPGPPRPGESIPCGVRIGPGTLAMGGSPLSQFANSLGMFAGRIVLDRTGLAGNYDIALTWTPDQMPRPAGDGPAPQINGVAVDPNGPSLFTAVPEQLGLKLDSQRGPVDTLVIDHAEKPVEN
jgi:uncharacterized protein (TIGR03435 family)